MTAIQIQLEKFRIAYDSMMVNVYDDFMVYSTPIGMADLISRSANKLIEELNLDLVAIPNKSYPSDSFVIKGSWENES